MLPPCTSPPLAVVMSDLCHSSSLRSYEVCSRLVWMSRCWYACCRWMYCPLTLAFHSCSVRCCSCWLTGENPQLSGGVSRAAEATSSGQAARVAVGGVQERPRP